MRLILAPHVDDDVIGCGGILDAWTVVYYFGVDDFHGVDRMGRHREANTLAARTGHSFYWPPVGSRKVNEFGSDFRGLVSDIEKQLAAIAPDEVLLPWPSYNQDHQAVYDAAMVALRPHDSNHFVRRVLLYEEPDCFWQPRTPFIPTLFRAIDADEKVARYELMASQVRGHRSPDHIRALAAVRGAAACLPAAEAYHVLRWVE